MLSPAMTFYWGLKCEIISNNSLKIVHTIPGWPSFFSFCFCPFGTRLRPHPHISVSQWACKIKHESDSFPVHLTEIQSSSRCYFSLIDVQVSFCAPLDFWRLTEVCGQGKVCSSVWCWVTCGTQQYWFDMIDAIFKQNFIGFCMILCDIASFWKGIMHCRETYQLSLKYWR